MPLYSEMSSTELEATLSSLRDQGQIAYDAQNWSHYEVLMKKWYLAKSYLLLPAAQIDIGKTYRLTEEHDRITVTQLVGVMAWGIKESTATEVAVPIAMLSATDES